MPVREDVMLGAFARMLVTCVVAAAMVTAANAQGSWTKKAPMAAALNEVAQKIDGLAGQS